ncbi:MAG: J domain-containing protein [Ignavibacteriae bacterium]|nr:MAG: J domain-containing protein [Ignavibacteriota bacterium]
MYKDYYKILGIEKTATPNEIKKAYRKLANKFHPDKNKGDKTAEDKFKDINEANGILSDPVKRKKYDQFGADWKQYEESGSRPGGFDWGKYSGGRGNQAHTMSQEEFSAMFGGEGEGDIFETIFGRQGGSRSGRRNRPSKGEDYEAELLLTLEEAYDGAERLLKVRTQTIKVLLKPGIADGQVLRVAGKGGRGSSGGPFGDIFITVKVAPHAEFQRKGNDLYCERPVDLYTAILGGKAKVQTLKNTVNVDIAKETPNGKILRLLGLGMPVYGTKNEFGNLYVTVSVQLPEHLTGQEIDLFRKLTSLRK